MSVGPVVEMLRSMRERDAAYAVAESLSELLAGEEAGLVDRGSWRPEIDVEETERFLAARTDDVLARWDAELATLKQ
jgi:hypothetical protein